MKITTFFHFLFPKTICIEPAGKFQQLQTLRFAKMGIVIHTIGPEETSEPASGTIPLLPMKLDPLSPFSFA